MSDVDLLTRLVAAQHAAIAGYAVLGAQLPPSTRSAAVAAYDAHRSSRDALSDQLRARHAPVPDPAPAYDVQVAGARRALALAVQLEEGLAGLWLDLVAGASDQPLRAVGVAGLTEVAVRAASWRVRAGRRPATVALPGS